MKNLLLTLVITLASLSFSKAQTAPDFSFTDIDGVTHTLSEALADGKVILLDFFFVDCPPCNTWGPEIDQIAADFEGTTLEVWAISDRDSDAYISSSIFNPTHTNHKVGGSAGGGADVVNLFAGSFTFSGFPTYSVICSDGTITWDTWPLTTGANELRSQLTEECGVTTAATPVKEVEGLSAVETYPNPTSEQVTIEFQLEAATNLTINISNSLGQTVKTIASTDYSAGEQKVELDVNDLATGIYSVSIQSESGVHTTQLTITK